MLKPQGRLKDQLTDLRVLVAGTGQHGTMLNMTFFTIHCHLSPVYISIYICFSSVASDASSATGQTAEASDCTAEPWGN